MESMRNDELRGREPAIVLIVDDQPANLGVLSRLLAEEGYRVRAVTSGERAVEAARMAPPDCMLLDVAMPGMDGFATCEAFQRDVALASIPIVFVTAFDDAEHKVRAFRAGGRDYISKPFQAEEVLARVRSQLRLARLEQQTRRYHQEALAAHAQLEELSQVKASLSAMLVHEVRSPLSLIGRVLHDRADEEAFAVARDAFRQINAMISDLLEIYRCEQAHWPAQAAEPVDLCTLLVASVAGARPIATARGVELAYRSPEDHLEVRGEPIQLDRAFFNLLDHALRLTPAGGRVVVDLDVEPGRGVERGLRFASIGVTDTGPGIPAADLPYIFDPYLQRGMAHGQPDLGLAVVQRVVAGHQGRIRVSSQPGVGTEFRVLLPL
jgi:two-component system sensor histidine kinase/response regulator